MTYASARQTKGPQCPDACKQLAAENFRGTKDRSVWSGLESQHAMNLDQDCHYTGTDLCGLAAISNQTQQLAEVSFASNAIGLGDMP